MLAVRVTPRAAREGLEGLADTGDGRLALVVRVQAAPSDGAANHAVLRLLAGRLGVPKRAVVLASGETGRIKQIRIEGPAETIALRLAEIARDVQT